MKHYETLFTTQKTAINICIYYLNLFYNSNRKDMKKPVGRPKKWQEKTEIKRFHQYLPLKAFPEILKAIDIICKDYRNDKV